MPFDARDVLDEADGIPETVDRAEKLELLTFAIQSLPERCRQVLTLRKIYGLSQREIAARLGISVCTVSAQLAPGASIETSTCNWGLKKLSLDLQGEYYVLRSVALFANLRNVTNATEDFEVAGPSTPPHAQFRSRQDFGSLWTIGVKGSF